MDQGLWPKIAISTWTKLQHKNLTLGFLVLNQVSTYLCKLLHKKPSVCKFMHTKWHLIQPTKQCLHEAPIQQ
jgi:hypothetical protein